MRLIFALKMSDKNEEVTVRFPDGRVNTMPRKTAEHPSVVAMGASIVEKTVKVPKHFAPIVTDEPEAEKGPEDEAEKPEHAHKTRKPRGPNKKKH